MGKKGFFAIFTIALCLIVPMESFGASAKLQKALVFIDVDNNGLAAVEAGNVITLDAYNIGGYTYFHLRDVAYIMNQSDIIFNVSWNDRDHIIEVVPGQKYIANGTEIKLDWNNPNKSYDVAPQGVDMRVNNHDLTLSAYNIEGFNYFQLRDLSSILGFGVNWLEDQQAIQIVTKVIDI